MVAAANGWQPTVEPYSGPRTRSTPNTPEWPRYPSRSARARSRKKRNAACNLEQAVISQLPRRSPLEFAFGTRLHPTDRRRHQTPDSDCAEEAEARFGRAEVALQIGSVVEGKVARLDLDGVHLDLGRRAGKKPGLLSWHDAPSPSSDLTLGAVIQGLRVVDLASSSSIVLCPTEQVRVVVPASERPHELHARVRPGADMPHCPSNAQIRSSSMACNVRPRRVWYEGGVAPNDTQARNRASSEMRTSTHNTTRQGSSHRVPSGPSNSDSCHGRAAGQEQSCAKMQGQRPVVQPSASAGIAHASDMASATVSKEGLGIASKRWRLRARPVNASPTPVPSVSPVMQGGAADGRPASPRKCWQMVNSTVKSWTRSRGSGASTPEDPRAQLASRSGAAGASGRSYNTSDADGSPQPETSASFGDGLGPPSLEARLCPGTSTPTEHVERSDEAKVEPTLAGKWGTCRVKSLEWLDPVGTGRLPSPRLRGSDGDGVLPAGTALLSSLYEMLKDTPPAAPATRSRSNKIPLRGQADDTHGQLASEGGPPAGKLQLPEEEARPAPPPESVGGADLCSDAPQSEPPAELDADPVPSPEPSSDIGCTDALKSIEGIASTEQPCGSMGATASPSGQHSGSQALAERLPESEPEPMPEAGSPPQLVNISASLPAHYSATGPTRWLDTAPYAPGVWSCSTPWMNPAFQGASIYAPGVWLLDPARVEPARDRSVTTQI